MDDYLRLKGMDYEWVHLNLSSSICTMSGMEIIYEGSYTKKGASGSAAPLQGRIRLHNSGKSEIASNSSRPDE
jgi:hypothetical protein